MPGDVNGPEPDAGSAADRERFALWYRLHHDRILGQCTRMLRDRGEAEDIAHETLLRAWLGRDRMRDEDLGAWLSVVARNLCVSHIRKQQRTVPTEVLPETTDEMAGPEALLLRKETGHTVRRALSEVGERHRRLLYLRDVQEVEYEELESELGLSPGGTRAVLFRARKMLRRRLAAAGEGFGAWALGARIRLGQAVRRVRDSLGGLESTGMHALQAGTTFAVAVAVTFGSPGSAASLLQRPATAAPSGNAIADALEIGGSTSVPVSVVGHGSASSGSDVDAQKPPIKSPHVSYNPDERSLFVEVPKPGDEGEPYRTGVYEEGDPNGSYVSQIEIFVNGALCAEAPTACDALREGA